LIDSSRHFIQLGNDQTLSDYIHTTCRRNPLCLIVFEDIFTTSPAESQDTINKVKVKIQGNEYDILIWTVEILLTHDSLMLELA